MPSVAELLERKSTTVDLEGDHFERLARRRDRKRRNQRIRAAALAIVVALVSLAALTRALQTSDRPADELTPKPPGIFSEVGGWITFGDKRGIWAVDPTRPEDPNGQIQLRTEKGRPLAWSSDGAKLLIQGRERYGPTVAADHHRRLFVLNADGTKTYLTTTEHYILGAGWYPPDIGGSFSPDGSKVIYANKSSIYLIDAHGGTPRVLHTATDRWFSVNGRRVHALLYNPTYSPDGTRIAYFDGAGRSEDGINHQLRVMNADGSGTRVLVDDLEANFIFNLAWSPDGERLAFGLGSKGIYIVGADGSGLTLAIPGGGYPYWSPDGTRIAFAIPVAGHPDIEPCPDPRCTTSFDRLEIAALDGTDVQEWRYAEPGPWNPLVRPEHEVAEVAAAGGSLTPTSLLLLGGVMLVAIGAVLAWSRRQHAKALNR